MRFVRCTLLAVILFLFNVSLVLGASVVITPATGNSFTIQGNNLDGVAGIDLVVNFDNSLSAPSVSQGGLIAATGAMFFANPNFSPHSIKIAIITTRTFSGSGQIATITFGKGSGKATITAKNLIDSTGAPIGATTTTTTDSGLNTTSGVPFSQPSQQASPSNTTTTSPSSSTTTAASSAASTTTPTYFGTVTMPADQQQRADSHSATSPSVPVNAGEPPAAGVAEQTQHSETSSVEAKPEETRQYVVYKGISDRFKQYTGNKTLSAMAALFDKKIAENIHQDPAIVLSDGKSRATLTIDIPARISTSPNFAVNGGALASFKQDKSVKGRWIVEILPEAAAGKVITTIIAGAEEFEFPLTVAPPVKTALTLDDSGWNRFLKETGTDKGPLHDLNNDGVRDYLDEFVFVANFLAGKTIPEKPAAPSRKSEKTRSLNGNK